LSDSLSGKLVLNFVNATAGGSDCGVTRFNPGDVLANKGGAQNMKGYVGSIETETLKTNYFRQVLFTGKHTQLVVMCLQPGEDIGKEMHPNVDQFFRIEQGEARFVFGENEEHRVKDGDAVIVPAGTFHNVFNTSKTTPLRVYTIYSPPNHPDGTVHKTKAEADAAEAAEPHHSG